MQGQRRLGIALWVLGSLVLWRGAAAQTAAGAGGEAVGGEGGPRPLTTAERQGVQLAAEYLAGGPEAWWPRLARGSWLRALGREAALAEIEVRVGAPAGSRWSLEAAPAWFAEHGAAFSTEFPSGEDDTLLLQLVQEDGEWKIDTLRVAAEGGSGTADGAPASAGTGGPARSGLPRGAGGWLRLLGRPAGLAVAGLVLAGALAWIGALVVAVRRRQERRRRAGRPVTPAGTSFVAVAPPRQPPWASILAVAGAALLALAAVQGVGLARGGAAPARDGEMAAGADGGPQGAVVSGVSGMSGSSAVSGASGVSGEPGAASSSGARPVGQAGAAGEAGPAGAGAVGETGAGGEVGAARAMPVQAPLRSLLPLRRAFTQAGGGAGEAGAGGGEAGAAAAIAGDTATARVARLWLAQHRIAAGDLGGAEALLRGLPPGSSQLAELLRARLALLRLQPVEAGVQYERAVAAGVAHEGLLLEAAQALYILGFEDTARRYLADLAVLGAREAEIYYNLADLALVDNRGALAHQRFRTAWRLQPEARADLLEEPLSAFMLQDRELRRLMSLGTFAEPAGSCADLPGRALELPPQVTARLLGETLRLAAGGGEVRAPGACDLAPVAAAQDSAAVWQQERESAALARLPDLQRSAASASSLAQPVLRHQTEEAAAALAKRQRWAELIAISDGLAQPGAILPPTLVRLRALALTRAGRRPEARQLLVRLALGDKVSRRADPAVLYQLAALLEQAGDFDQAIRLVAKANSQLPSPPSGDRLRQLQMEKRLAGSSERLRSAHFVLSYPAGRGPAFGQEALRILEAEHTRLQRWIPGAGGEAIEVRLLPWDDFELAYSAGGEILGLFDGVVRVPLGSLRTFSPPAVAVMSHELAHALIAQRTGDRAPHWFHEGLAQHIEMSEAGRVNPVAEYRAQDRLLAFPLLEPALASYSSAVWTVAAYDEALWTINFVESRHGVGGIHRLLDAFRAGQPTDQALATALGTSGARFDHDLWEWCLGGAPRAWRLDVVRYDGGPGQPKRF